MSTFPPHQPEPMVRGGLPVRALVFERDSHACAAMLRTLEACGFAVARVASAADIVDALRDGLPTVVVADLFGDDRLFDDLRAGLAASPAQTSLIALSGTLSAQRAVRWMRSGADDVLVKPIDPLELRAAATRAAERLVIRLRIAPTRLASGGDPLAAIVGSDPRLQRALDMARAASRVRSTTLIQGETGTGKSTLARAIHESGSRAGKPFVEIACGSIPEALLESELFGHVKGAFTGAVADKKGRFLAADGGTLFLDEINTATSTMQVKLLRALQERAFEPVGSDETIQVDVRVIVATNQPLERLVDEGRFSPDLYYRVHVLPIDLPPLRERTTDLERLAVHFLARKSAEIERTILGFEPDAIETMRRYHWPGNIRELENAVERAVILCDGARIGAGHLPDRVLRASTIGAQADAPSPLLKLNTAPTAPVSPQAQDARTLSQRLRDPERAALLDTLEKHGWNRTQAAKALGINRTTLYRKMRDLGLTHLGEAG
ncbi:MAG: sigma-54 dependent transcriptional regulator [Planctomycetota bacterium]|nr:sigma-54 dependent transcriptional regulator [Planctomycetota bacterium]